MPTLGQIAATGASSAYSVSQILGAVEASSAGLGPSDIYITPIVPDQTHFSDEATTGAQELTLRDVAEGQDWLLKRIVGKIYVSAMQKTETTDAGGRNVLVGAGFFVGPADKTNPNVPEGPAQEYDPLGCNQIREPWIWRRTWNLTNSSQPTLDLTSSWPPSNVWFGLSSDDGPHIDAKTARRIRREERLWFVVNAYAYTGVNWDVAADYAVFQPVTFALDYRILGQMRRGQNRSTFG